MVKALSVAASGRKLRVVKVKAVAVEATARRSC